MKFNPKRTHVIDQVLSVYFYVYLFSKEYTKCMLSVTLKWFSKVLCPRIWLVICTFSIKRNQFDLQIWSFNKVFDCLKNHERSRKCKYLTWDSSIRNLKTGTEKTGHPPCDLLFDKDLFIDHQWRKDPSLGSTLVIHSILGCKWDQPCSFTWNYKNNRYTRSSSNMWRYCWSWIRFSIVRLGRLLFLYYLDDRTWCAYHKVLWFLCRVMKYLNR